MKPDRELGRRLGEVETPDEAGAERRAWEIVRAAHAQRAPASPPRTTRRLALGAAGAAVLLAIGLSPAGAKVADLVRDVVSTGEPDAKPALRSLPAAGELLVESRQGPWIVREDGSKRLLGDYSDASWSPHGLFVAVADGDRLLAVEPDGDVRWASPPHARVHDPRWSPSGFRIAYRSGDGLRVVAGDGTGDRLLAREVTPVAPAWRPLGDQKLTPAGGPHVLTFVARDGKVQTVDVDTGEAVSTTRSDRRRLSHPPSGKLETRALSPNGTALARVARAGSRDRLIVTRKGGGGAVLFGARSQLTGPTWSPDGRWLLVGWPAADQWLFINADRPGRVIAIDRIREQFDPGGSGGGRFPRVSGWVLAER